MKVLLVGSGGREHALAWKLKQSPKLTELYCAPGHGGLGDLAVLMPEVAAEDVPGQLALARTIQPDLVIIGPEAPLVAGLADALRDDGFKVFGPNAAAARIEGSKAFSKDFMARNNLPTAVYKNFTAAQPALDYLKTQKYPLVVKADGLAAGKGVIICQNEAEAQAAVKSIMVDSQFGAEAGAVVVIEEFLEGEEASCLCFTDGQTVWPMPSAQDHKAVFDSDIGPNTGGMGAYSPAPVVTGELAGKILQDILKPAVKALADEGSPFCGVLYAGLMITKDGPKLLEFNARFGDPETQPLMMRLESDLLDICLAAAEGRLSEVEPKWSPEPAVCVVMAAEGYPGAYRRGDEIKGLKEAEEVPGVKVFLAGVKREKRLTGPVASQGVITYQGPGSLQTEDVYLTNGGRVLGVAAAGPDLQAAIDRVYKGVDEISWEGAHFRRDIGQKALKR